MQQKGQIYSTIKQRILYFVDNFLKISHRDFYEITGISRGTLTNSSSISQKSLSKLFDSYPDLNKNWVLTGDGKMQAKNASLIASQSESQNEHSIEDNPRSTKDLSLRYEICTQMRQKLEETNGDLREMIGGLKEQNKQLVKENAQLKAKLAKYEDNSSNHKGKAV